MFDGGRFLERDVVVVVINYRLNIFGTINDTIIVENTILKCI